MIQDHEKRFRECFEMTEEETSKYECKDFRINVTSSWGLIINSQLTKYLEFAE